MVFYWIHLEKDHNGKRPQWKKTTIEKDHTGQKPQWKNTMQEKTTVHRKTTVNMLVKKPVSLFLTKETDLLTNISMCLHCGLFLHGLFTLHSLFFVIFFVMNLFEADGFLN